jgi:transcriptional regulator with XRE-family HTH domain
LPYYTKTMTKSIFKKDYEKLLQKIKTARKEAGLTQKEAAKKLGTVQPFLSKIETGERRIDVIELKKLAEIYKKKISYFL